MIERFIQNYFYSLSLLEYVLTLTDVISQYINTSTRDTLFIFQEILLANSAWQFSRQNLRLTTILGEGNFGRVSLFNNIFSIVY